METHLNDVEIAQALLGTAAAEVRRHLEACPGCRGEYVRLDSGLAGYGAALRAQAERPEFFWRRQRAEVGARLSRPQAAGSLRWALAGGLALLALALGLVSADIRPAAPVQAQIDPDDALLVDIQHSLQHQVPAPLLPAALLVEEVRAGAQGPNPEVKEN